MITLLMFGLRVSENSVHVNKSLPKFIFRRARDVDLNEFTLPLHQSITGEIL